MEVIDRTGQPRSEDSILEAIRFLQTRLVKNAMRDPAFTVLMPTMMECLRELLARRVENERLRHDVEKRILTCVYCGEEYPDKPDRVTDEGRKTLTEHIQACPKHPLRAAEATIAGLRESLLSIQLVAQQQRNVVVVAQCKVALGEGEDAH